jgi:hypothetical protein
VHGRDQSAGSGDDIGRWRDLYRRLLAISRSQKALLDRHAEDDAFADRFAELARDWNDVREEIRRTEARLMAAIGEDRLRRLFATDILPIVRETEAAIGEAADAMRRHLGAAGNALRAIREGRQMRDAYADPEPASQTSIFFDEKK